MTATAGDRHGVQPLLAALSAAAARGDWPTALAQSGALVQRLSRCLADAPTDAAGPTETVAAADRATASSGAASSSSSSSESADDSSSSESDAWSDSVNERTVRSHGVLRVAANAAGERELRPQLAVQAAGVTLCERLGRGANAVVYRGVTGGVSFAVKCVDTSTFSARDAGELERAVELAERCAALPHVLPALGADFSRPTEARIFSELVPITLRGMLDLQHKRFGGVVPLDARLALMLLLQVAVALDAMHGESVLHRDVKAENVFVRSRAGDNKAKCSICSLCNVGDASVPCEALLGDLDEAVCISSIVDKNGKPRKGVRVPRPMGTCEYQPPEALRLPNDKLTREEIALSALSTKADVYSFGMLIFEVCTLDVPYRRNAFERQMQVIEAITHGEAPKWVVVSDPQPWWIAELRQLHRKCTAFSASRRPPMSKIISRLRRMAKRAAVLRREEMQSSAVQRGTPSSPMLSMNGKSLPTISEDFSLLAGDMAVDRNAQVATRATAALVKQQTSAHGKNRLRRLSGRLSGGPLLFGGDDSDDASMSAGAGDSNARFDLRRHHSPSGTLRATASTGSVPPMLASTASTSSRVPESESSGRQRHAGLAASSADPAAADANDHDDDNDEPDSTDTYVSKSPTRRSSSGSTSSSIRTESSSNHTESSSTTASQRASSAPLADDGVDGKADAGSASSQSQSQSSAPTPSLSATGSLSTSGKFDLRSFKGFKGFKGASNKKFNVSQ